MPNFTQVYRHAIKKNVWVRPETEGLAPYRSLCTSCTGHGDCAILAELQRLSLNTGIVTPVYECPQFNERRDDADASH